MKFSVYIATVFFLLTIFACKKECHETTTVVKDCTGTYLRWDGKDYRVCNLEKVVSFANGETVTATFKRINNCNGSGDEEIVCAMVHANEGWIEVKKIE